MLQYAGIIATIFALIAPHGTLFGRQISMDRDILQCIVLAGLTAMYVGYYERRMIQIAKAIKDSEQAKPA